MAQGFDAQCLFFGYGQASAAREATAAKAISLHYKVPLRSIECTGIRPSSGMEVRGRNALLLTGALIAMDTDAGIIGLGVHAGTPYSDCSPYFIREMQRLFDLYTGGLVKIGAPFLNWSKRQIWDYGHSTGVPLTLTYSCELGRDQPCGQCLSCRDLLALNAS